VGKSTLLNALVRENRVITGPTPGLTRDAIAVDWTWQGQPIQIVDTAGIRKSTSKTSHSGSSDNNNTTNLDDLAVQDAIAAMKLAEVGVLVLDAGIGRLHQLELSICDAIMKEGRALIVVANKMDLLEFDAEYTHGDLVRQVRSQLEERFPALRQTPIIAMSSRDGIGVNKLLPVALETRERWEQTIPTSKLNRWMKEVQATTKSPIKIKYMVQTKGRPPTFILFCNRPTVRQNYENMIRRHFQESFRMFGMEVRLTFRTATNPYVTDQPRRRGFGLGGHTARKQRNLTTLRERYRGVTTKQEGRMRIDEKRRSKRKNRRQQRR
jgi:GTPase